MEYVRKVIDGFEIKEEVAKGSSREEELKDITIIFKKEEEFFTEAKHRKVPSSKVEKIRERLEDNISYNKSVEEECRAIALPTLLFQIEDIIYS